MTAFEHREIRLWANFHVLSATFGGKIWEAYISRHARDTEGVSTNSHFRIDNSKEPRWFMATKLNSCMCMNPL